MKVNNKGLSVVELIVSFVLCILVFVFIIQVVSSVEELYINLGVKTELLNKQSLISEQINNKFLDKKTILIKNCGDDCLTFFYKDNTSEKMQIDKANNNFIFGDDVYNFNGLGFVESLGASLNNDYTYNQGILTINLNIKNSIFDNGKYLIKAFYQFSNNETVYSPSTSNKAEIFLLGPAVSYKFSNDLFIEPGWIVYYPDGRVVINSSDVQPSALDFDSDGNGFIRYHGINDAAGVEKTRTIKTYETAFNRIKNLHSNSPSEGLYEYNGTGRIVYKGEDPHNYLAIGSRIFRIISLDNQSNYDVNENGEIVKIDDVSGKDDRFLLKVVSNDYLQDENGLEELPFSSAENINVLDGSAVWSKKICDGNNCRFEKQYVNSVANDYYLPALLNTGAGRLQITNGVFNIGTVPWETYKYGLSLSFNNLTYERRYEAYDIYTDEGADRELWDQSIDRGKWRGDCLSNTCGPNAGILSATDVLFSSADPGCYETIIITNSDGISCVHKNWLWPEKKKEEEALFYRLMTRVTYENTWTLTNDNYFSQADITVQLKTRPTLYLDASLYITGNGTIENPYVLYTIEHH